MEPTPAEAEILDYLVRGKTNNEIARALTVAPSTVKRHLHNVYPKLGARNRTQAALIWRARAYLREVK